MDAQRWQQYLDLDLLTCQIVATVEARPWGYAVYNVSNRDHFDANTARWRVKEMPDEWLAEVISLYHGLSLDARLRLPDCDNPAPAQARLQAMGFSSVIKPMRLMWWEHQPVRPVLPPTGVEILPAESAAIESLADIGLASNNWPGRAWFTTYLNYISDSVQGALYYALVNGAPAAMAALLQGEHGALIENVATRPEYRRQGLAETLIRHIQNHAFTPLCLTVEDDGAERIYKRAGFDVVGEFREVEGHLPVAR